MFFQSEGTRKNNKLFVAFKIIFNIQQVVGSVLTYQCCFFYIVISIPVCNDRVILFSINIYFRPDQRAKKV